MKKFLLILLAFLTCSGCVSARIPKYLGNDFPYKQRFYFSFEQVVSATQETLKDLGWQIEETADPAVYEQVFSLPGADKKQILIFTSIRQTPLFIGTRYAKMNIFLGESGDNNTEMEIRYLTVNSVLFKNFESYKNESAVKRILEHISKSLGQSPKMNE
ncbi:MAG: hypothetical protein WC552_00245 [Candidatus Omnitrophota bacterium]